MLDEGILRHWDRIVGFYKVKQSFISHIEVECVGVVEVILGNVDCRFVHI